MEREREREGERERKRERERKIEGVKQQRQRWIQSNKQREPCPVFTNFFLCVDASDFAMLLRKIIHHIS